MRDGWTPDRRRADRRRVRGPLVAIHEDTGARWPVVDIGPLGLVIEVDGPLSPGAPFPCVFGDDTTRVGPVAGRVAHCRLLLGSRGAPARYVAGISFGTVTTTVRAQLDTLLARFDAAAASQDPS